MKAKLFGFAVAVVSAAILGLVQLQAQADNPGQVGSAPRCTATAVGSRASAFQVSGGSASVKFTVSGKKGCRVELSANSFYAPSSNGKPYDKQILYKRVTKTFTPGTYTMTVGVPTSSTPAKGCYYQLDLTYGIHNHTPVLAYKIGKITGCGQTTPPSATCDSLDVSKQDETTLRFTAHASVKNGAKINSYTYAVSKGGAQVFTKTTPDTSLTYTPTEKGDYTVTLTVNTSVGAKTSAACTKPFTLTEQVENHPSVVVNKLVDGAKYEQVGVNVEYSYQIGVVNNGDTDLTEVKVTDTPEDGVTLVDADKGDISGNTWTYTIPTLGKGETMNFTLKAKVPVYKAGKIKNTVCVDAKEVEGNPDDCDTADVDVPPEGKVKVCNPDTGKVMKVDETDKDKYLPVGDEACQPQKESPPPEELPHTGPADTILQILGVSSLTGSLAYYLASRRFNG